ncbi:MAG: SRPBCC family protein [Pirellulales bacterium]
MLKILLIIAAVILVVLVAMLAYAATKPNTYRVERSTRVKASPAKIISLIKDFHEWARWSPYEKLDPDMTRTFSGSEQGPGAVYEWNGDGNVGQGRMEILEVTPDKVTIKLDFFRPMEGHNTAEFTLVPQGEETEVTWSMHGPSKFITKVMSTYLNLDGMIGNQFAEGLNNLKTIAEK